MGIFFVNGSSFAELPFKTFFCLHLKVHASAQEQKYQAHRIAVEVRKKVHHNILPSTTTVHMNVCIPGVHICYICKFSNFIIF